MLDQITPSQLSAFSAAVRAGAVPADPDLAGHVLELLSAAAFTPGLPLIVFVETSSVEQEESVARSVGICESASVAREVAATHFASGEARGPEFDQAHKQLLLRLDLRSEPMFAAAMPRGPRPPAAPKI